MLRRLLNLILCLGFFFNLFDQDNVNASLVIGNLPATPAADNSSNAGLSHLNQKAIRFTMGANNYTVDDLVLRLDGYNSAGEVFAQIRDFTGSSTTVGTTTLLNFTPSAPGGAGPAIYTFTVPGSFALQANTSYWLVVGGIAGQSFDWRATTTALDPYTGFATYNNGLATNDGGSNWSASGQRNYFNLNGTAVPEPSASGLVLCSACLSVIRRRRA